MTDLPRRTMLAAAVSTTAFGGETDFAGYVAGEGRFFLNDPALPGQDDASQLSAVIEPELRWYSDDDNHAIALIPFAIDDADLLIGVHAATLHSSDSDDPDVGTVVQ